MIVGKRARIIGLTLGTALISLIGSSAVAGQTETSAQSGPVAAARPSQPWPQEASDVPADKAVRFGTLANGMRYEIMHNATPPGQSSLMLRIDAGSLMEKDDQLGLAHFMEHMAFNGTTHIPKNDLILTLQRLGLAFGADLNAATSFDQTFYQLHLPKSDDKTIDTGLFVLREQVSEATMDQQDIVDERGVIAGEERLRNSPGLRVAHKQLALIAKGQKVADRFPIGDLKIINTATRDRFVDFYNSYYRPSRATIVAVGDFDVDAMEAKIKKQFGDWQPKGPEGPEPDLGQVATHHGEVQLTVEPGSQSSLSLTWAREPDLSPDTVAKRRHDIIEELGFAVLNRRLSELSRTDDPPFIDARGADGNVMRSVRSVTVMAQFIPGKWQRALAAIDREQRQLVEYGVTDVELAREVDDFRLRWTNAAKTAPTRNTRFLAGKMINSVNDREVMTAPDTDARIFEEAVKGLTASQVNAELKPLFVGPPMTLISTPETIPGGEAAVASAVSAVRSAALAPPVAPVTMPWPYTNFGPPGAVVAKRELTELGATIVTFQNGVTLTFKHTDFDKNTVSVDVLTGSGEQAFSADKFDPRFVLVGGLESGGLGKMTYDEMRRSLNGHVVRSSLATLGDRFLLSGTTRGEDLQLEAQMMTALLTDPAYRSAPFERIKATYPSTYKILLSQPAGAFEAYAKDLLAGGDKRTAITAPDAIASLSMDAYRPQLKALLSKGPIEVTMVGDLTLDDAIRVTANTFGALPPRPAVDPVLPGADKRGIPGPTATPLKFTHEGLAEQSMGYIAWPATDITRDLKEARRIEMLNAVLKLRVYDEIRERLGLAYSPSVGASFSDTYKGYGLLTVSAQTAPEKLPAFFKAMDDIVEKLRNEPITPDELKRAREPLVANALRSRNTNGWWLSKLVFMVDRPWYEPQIFTDVAELESLTPADIQALARKYLRPELAWKAEVLPATAAQPTAAGLPH
jgi:zinc protease